MTPRELFDAHQSLARYTARRIARGVPHFRAEYDELCNAALAGLWRAANHYDPARHVKFRTYAALVVRGAVLDWLRETNPARRRSQAPQECSLEHLPEAELDVCLAVPGCQVERQARLRDLVAALSRDLGPRHREVIDRYYRGHQPMREIAAALGCEESNVSRAHKAALAKMRKAAAVRHLDDSIAD